LGRAGPRHSICGPMRAVLPPSSPGPLCGRAEWPAGAAGALRAQFPTRMALRVNASALGPLAGASSGPPPAGSCPHPASTEAPPPKHGGLRPPDEMVSVFCECDFDKKISYHQRSCRRKIRAPRPPGPGCGYPRAWPGKLPRSPLERRAALCRSGMELRAAVAKLLRGIG
jgi:hypothetical protein